MGEEISRGANLGVILIALAVVIGLGFSIFSIAKGTANEGVTKMQTTMANVQASELKDYDQTVVTGTQVKSALENFEGKSVAILIATKAIQGAATDTTKFAGSTGKTFDKLPKVTIGSFKFINYNALLKGTATVNDKGEITGTSSPELKMDNGKYVASDGFVVDKDAGAVVFYNDISDINKSGMSEYINAGSKFNANLVIDNSGTIIGIVFTQIGAK